MIFQEAPGVRGLLEGVSSPSIADGWPVDVVTGVEVEPVTGGDVVIRASHDAFLQVNIESVVPEHSTRCKLLGKFIRIWIKYFGHLMHSGGSAPVSLVTGPVHRDSLLGPVAPEPPRVVEPARQVRAYAVVVAGPLRRGRGLGLHRLRARSGAFLRHCASKGGTRWRPVAKRRPGHVTGAERRDLKDLCGAEGP